MRLLIFLVLVFVHKMAFANNFSFEKYQRGLLMVTEDFENFLSEERRENTLQQNYQYIYQYDINVNFKSKDNVIIYSFIPTPLLEGNLISVGGGVIYWFDIENEIISKRLFQK